MYAQSGSWTLTLRAGVIDWNFPKENYLWIQVSDWRNVFVNFVFFVVLIHSIEIVTIFEFHPIQNSN